MQRHASDHAPHALHAIVLYMWIKVTYVCVYQSLKPNIVYLRLPTYVRMVGSIWALQVRPNKTAVF